MLNRWLRFWFEPTSPENLGTCRMLFFTGLLVLYAAEDFSAWGDVSSAFWMPLPLFAALHLTAASPAALDIAQTVWRAALVLSAVGLFSRVSMAVAAALSVYLLGLPHNFGHTYHFDAALVITSVVLACSRAGDACSLDAAMRHSRPQGDRTSGDYTWPIRLVWVTTSLVFLAAGVAKLRYGGIAWVFSDNMRILLLRAAYHVSDADPITHTGLWIAAHPWLSRMVAGTTLTIELGFVLSLVSTRARFVFVPGAALMLLGIRALMGPTFGGFLILNVFWVPWDVVAARAGAWSARRVSSPAQAGQYNVTAEDAERRAGAEDVLIEHL